MLFYIRDMLLSKDLKQMNKIKNIIIVGGGSAGWMTATTLLSQFPDKKITLVESPNIPTIGVGESTVAGGQAGFSGIINWLRMVEIGDEFMPHADATYKLSVAFQDFYYKDSGSFHYPFGIPYLENNNSKMNDWYLKKIKYPDTPVSDYVDCLYPTMALVNQNKSIFTDNFSSTHGRAELQKRFNIHEVQLLSRYSYQFDATKFGTWLKDHYCKAKHGKNFTHVLAEVRDIPLNEEGIKYLLLDTGQKLTGDLFIDCTGFRSLLMSKFKIPFNSLNDLIPNNYAWATKIPYVNKNKQLTTYTNCTAIENGWVWEIPLWSRLGVGYVFSDKYVSHDDALKEFKKVLIKKGYSKVEELEYRLIPMRCGIQSQLWIKNTCAIGLSAGFIEPLHANGLLSTHEFLFSLVRILAQDRINQWDRQCYTAKCKFDFDRFAALVALTYTLSRRDDTEYWRELQNKTWPDVLTNHVSWGHHNVFWENKIVSQYDDLGPFPCISAGMHWPPVDIHTLKYKDEFWEFDKHYDLFINQLEQRKARWNREVKDFPSPYEYLKKHVHK